MTTSFDARGPKTDAPRGERGQVLPLFVFFMAALLAMAALLFDGANALGERRRLQDAADAAALAGANVFFQSEPRGCSAVSTPVPGPVQSRVSDAVIGSIAQNLAGYTLTDLVISCPARWNNEGVHVSISTRAATFFGRALNPDMRVAVTAESVNGQIAGFDVSVLTLDPSACRSLYVAGRPHVILEASVQSNSSCPASAGGAFAVEGSSPVIEQRPPARIRVVGGYQSSIVLDPPPITGVPVMQDPFAGLPALDVGRLPIRSTSRLVIENTLRVLDPGVYRGGIEVTARAVALLRPGVYVLDGGGLKLTGQLYSIPTAALSAPGDADSWSLACLPGNCGVLFFNTATDRQRPGPIEIAGGSVFRLRGYSPGADPYGPLEHYRNLMFWQTAALADLVSLTGGSDSRLIGSVYAPNAKVLVAGNATAEVAESIDFTAQFVARHVELKGNSIVRLRYAGSAFTKPLSYGLVE